jgi:O-acetyl-ADP-ribose deacetylase (regulator of RNase III)
MDKVNYFLLKIIVCIVPTLAYSYHYEVAALDTSLRSLSSKLSKNNLTLKHVSTLRDSVNYTLGDITISLKKGNMLTIPADAIVNPANEACLGGGGLDGQITKAGGRSLSNVRSALPVVNGVRCPEGDARITRAGELEYPDPQNQSRKIPFKYIIHAVALQCTKFTKEELKQKQHQEKQQREYQGLVNTYINSLARIDTFNSDPKNTNNDPRYPEFSKIDINDLGPHYRIKTISFPTLGTGIFNCSTEGTAPMVVKGVIDYIKNHPNISVDHIIFAFYDPSDPNKALADFSYYKAAFDRLIGV